MQYPDHWYQLYHYQSAQSYVPAQLAWICTTSRRETGSLIRSSRKLIRCSNPCESFGSAWSWSNQSRWSSLYGRFFARRRLLLGNVSSVVGIDCWYYYRRGSALSTGITEKTRLKFLFQKCLPFSTISVYRCRGSAFSREITEKMSLKISFSEMPALFS